MYVNHGHGYAWFDEMVQEKEMYMCEGGEREVGLFHKRTDRCLE